MTPKSQAITENANDIDVIVTGPSQIRPVSSSSRRSRDRATVQIEARRPRSSESLGVFLDGLVSGLAAKDEPPTAALAAAGQAVRGTPWSGYRNGRNRLATMAAAYLHWLKPGPAWTFSGALEVEDRRPLVWTGEDGRRLIDLLDVNGNAQALVGPTFLAGGEIGPLAGVRLLRLDAPARSLFYSSPTRHERLLESDYWFEAVR